MARKMTLAPMEYMDTAGPDSQHVAVLEEPGRLAIRYARIPEAGAGQVRIRIKWVGICGSDIEAFRGTRQAEFLAMPARLGHEVAGVIDQVGDGVNGLEVGEQVACRYVWGAFAEYILAEPFHVKVVPPTVPLREVSLIEVLPGVLHAAELGEIGANTSVLIMGQGVSGLVLTQVLSLYSPRHLVVTDIKDANLALAKSYGATDTVKLSGPDSSTWDALKDDYPEGFDVVIPSLLEGDGFIDAVDAAAMNGKIVLYGCIGVCNKPVDFFKVHRKRLTVYSTEPRRDIDMRRFFQESVQLVADGLVDTGAMVTHTFHLDDIQAAFEKRNDKSNDSIHVLVDCEYPRR